MTVCRCGYVGGGGISGVRMSRSSCCYNNGYVWCTAKRVGQRGGHRVI